MRHAANQRERRRSVGRRPSTARRRDTVVHRRRAAHRARQLRPGTVVAMRTPLPSPIRVHGAVPGVVVALLMVALLSLARPAGALGAPVDPVPVGVWPLQPQPEVVRAFEPPDTLFGAGHRGVDLAGSVGQPVVAALAGRVTFAGPTGRPRRRGRRPRPDPYDVRAGGRGRARGPVRACAGSVSAPWSSAAPTASRACACTGGGGAVRPTSTRCSSSAEARSGCSLCGGPIPCRAARPSRLASARVALRRDPGAAARGAGSASG